jgi:hypothetical protein
MLFEGQSLGRDEDQATSDAIQIAQRQKMEKEAMQTAKSRISEGWLVNHSEL